MKPQWPTSATICSCRKAHDLHTRVWDVYHAATAAEFRRLMHELQQWFEPQTWPAPVRAASAAADATARTCSAAVSITVSAAVSVVVDTIGATLDIAKTGATALGILAKAKAGELFDYARAEQKRREVKPQNADVPTPKI